MIIIANKILLVLFIMALLNIIRHVYFGVQAVIVTNADTESSPYKLNRVSLWLLSISIAYVLASIITGIFI